MNIMDKLYQEISELKGQVKHLLECWDHETHLKECAEYAIDTLYQRNASLCTEIDQLKAQVADLQSGHTRLVKALFADPALILSGASDDFVEQVRMLGKNVSDMWLVRYRETLLAHARIRYYHRHRGSACTRHANEMNERQ